jgi:methionine synthase II (cobalamin-independent)
MFATLLGALPDPPDATDPDARLAAMVAAQVEAGLEPITDGEGARDPDDGVVDRWHATAGLTDRAVKAVLVGPWTAAWSAAGSATSGVPPGPAAVLAESNRLRRAVTALAAAGCPLVEIEEAEADRIGADVASRAAFRGAHIDLASAVDATHLALSIVGGSAWDAGAATILDAPYRSLAVDLIAGPDNWNLVTRAPADRGIVAGALDATKRIPEGPELMVWAAHYSASTRGRGLARVGLGTAGTLAQLSWDDAIARLRSLAEAARIAELPRGELADALDPRAVSSRAAATGLTRHRDAEQRRREGSG